MTEQEWITSADPVAMLEIVNHDGRASGPRYSDRKKRLFACACCRQVWPQLTDPRSRRAVEVAERFADGGATSSDLDRACYGAIDPGDIGSVQKVPCWLDSKFTGARLLSNVLTNAGEERDWPDGADAAQAALLRDIFGNPWRPSPCKCRSDFAPHDYVGCPVGQWTTPTVTVLARAAYEERVNETGRVETAHLDPDRLLVLADALEEAGCTNEELLRHLRGQELCWDCGGTGGFQANSTWIPCEGCDADGDCYTDWSKWSPWRPMRGSHARGCWAVELLMGSE